MYLLTYNGLHKWYTTEIDKFGWILIFYQNEQNNEYKNKKISLYLESLNELDYYIDKKISNLEKQYNDLEIISKNLKKFIIYANSILVFDSIGGGGNNTITNTIFKSPKKILKMSTNKQYYI
jgi:hypothetical protein